MITKRFIGLVATQVLLGMLLSLIMTFFGFLISATLGGQFGFPHFYGMPGYEGSALIGIEIGSILGSWFGIALGGMLWKELGNDKLAALVLMLPIIPYIILGFFVGSSAVFGNVFLALSIILYILAIGLWHKK